MLPPAMIVQISHTNRKNAIDGLRFLRGEGVRREVGRLPGNVERLPAEKFLGVMAGLRAVPFHASRLIAIGSVTHRPL
jgi:hypothetical protein